MRPAPPPETQRSRLLETIHAAVDHGDARRARKLLKRLEADGVDADSRLARWRALSLEEDLEPVWPETYAAMPPSVQALMPGLRARAREEVFESAFDLSELNRGRFERRRREAEGYSSL